MEEVSYVVGCVLGRRGVKKLGDSKAEHQSEG